MLRLFCDLCAAEIPDGARSYDVIMRVMKDPEEDADEVGQEYSRFCYACTKSGEALMALMEWYEERRAAEMAAAKPGVVEQIVNEGSIGTGATRVD